MGRRTFTVSGMACDGCESLIESALSSLDSVTTVEADHEAETVAIVSREDASTEEIVDAISDAGYEVRS